MQASLTAAELDNLRAVNPPHLQILRTDMEWVMDDVIMQAHDVIFWKKKTHKKDVVFIVTFDLIGLLSTNHIIAYYNGIRSL